MGLIKTYMFCFDFIPLRYFEMKYQNISLKTAKWDFSSLPKPVIARFDSQKLIQQTHRHGNCWTGWCTFVPTGGSSMCKDSWYKHVSPTVPFTPSWTVSKHRLTLHSRLSILTKKIFEHVLFFFHLRNTKTRASVLCWIRIRLNSSIVCYRAEASSF